MIVALAGRRVDATDAKEKRFSPENAESVKERIRKFLQTENATALVSAAACGADILDQAEELAEETGEQLSAVVVWNGQSRGENDVTMHFLEEAKQRGLKVTEIKTM